MAAVAAEPVSISGLKACGSDSCILSMRAAMHTSDRGTISISGFFMLRVEVGALRREGEGRLLAAPPLESPRRPRLPLLLMLSTALRPLGCDLRDDVWLSLPSSTEPFSSSSFSSSSSPSPSPSPSS